MIKVILYRPEMAGNVGNIIRTCATTLAELHIIGPVPFARNSAVLKRAGLDYQMMTDIFYYDDFASFLASEGHPEIYVISRYGEKTYDEPDYGRINGDIHVMFGNETSGISEEIMRLYPDKRLRIPMAPFARSLNLSNAVAVVVYEILKKKSFASLAMTETVKGDKRK